MESNLGMTELKELITRVGDSSKVRMGNWYRCVLGEAVVQEVVVCL